MTRPNRLAYEALTGSIIACALEVHRTLGPGLLESTYEECLCQELSEREIPFQRQVCLPLRYKGRVLRSWFRIDVLVSDAVVVELKSVERILALHESQLLTYMRQSGKRVGLLLNFYVPLLRDGIVRRIL